MKSYLIVLVIIINNTTMCSQKRNDSYLDSMAKILNSSILKYKELYDDKGFYILNKKPKNFFIYNLIDTNNNSYPTSKPINIRDEGIYHFSPVRFRFSFSHIAVIKYGKMKVFRYLNCKNVGDDINDVIKYLEDNFKYNKIIMEQVKNYRKHGMYFKTVFKPLK